MLGPPALPLATNAWVKQQREHDGPSYTNTDREVTMASFYAEVKLGETPTCDIRFMRDGFLERRTAKPGELTALRRRKFRALLSLLEKQKLQVGTEFGTDAEGNQIVRVSAI